MKKIRKVLAFCMSAIMTVTALGSSFTVFAKSEGTAAVQNYEISYAETPKYSITGTDGNTSFSELLSSAVSTEIDNQEINTDYTILGVDITGNNCTVDYAARYDSTLVVGIYDETSGMLYTTASAEILASENTTSVLLDSEHMPEYYVVKAYIIDPETMRPLNKSYVSNKYTKAIAEIDALTVNDFEDCVVVNLDDNIQDNFTVFEQDVNVFYENFTLTEQSDTESVSTYVIETTDDKIKSLKTGDKFAFMGKEDMSETNVGVVSTITVSDDTVTIITAPLSDMSINDFFMCIKISADKDDKNTETTSVDNNETLTADTDSGNNSDKQGNFELEVNDSAHTVKITYKYEKKNSNGLVTGTCGVSVLFDSSGTDIKLNDGTLLVTLKISYEATLNAEVTIVSPDEWCIPIEKAKVPIVGGICFELDIEFYLQLEAKITVEVTLKGTFGYEYDGSKASSEKLNNLSTTPVITTDFKIEGTITVGFKIKGSLAWVDEKVLSVGVEVDASAKINGVYTVFAETTAHPLTNHLCDAGIDSTVIESLKGCIDGSSSISFKVNVELTLATKSLAKRTLFEKTFPGPKWYLSKRYGDGGFDMSCPHQGHRVDVTVVNSFGIGVPNAKITYTDKSLENLSKEEVTVTTDKQGKATIYLCGPTESGKRTNRTQLKVSADGYKNVTGLVKVNAELINEANENNKPITQTIQIFPQNGGWKSVSLGKCTTAAITMNNELYMWGDNGSSGQFGNGTTEHSSTPIKIMDNVESVVTREYVTAAIKTNGELWMWGNNSSGRLGNDSTQISTVPIHIMNDVASVSLDEYTVSAVTKNGELYTWGDGSYYKLCDGLESSRQHPEKVMNGVISAATGSGHTAVLNSNGLQLCGANHYGQIGNGTYGSDKTAQQLETIKGSVSSISLCGNKSACVSGGLVYIWGSGTGVYSNGNRYSTEFSTRPMLVACNGREVCAGPSSWAYIDNNNDLYLWGSNLRGQLGTGDKISQEHPVKILENVKSVSLGGYHSAAVTQDNNLYIWGTNTNGCLGIGQSSYTPVLVPLPVDSSAANLDSVTVSNLDAEAVESFTFEELNTSNGEMTLDGLVPNMIYNVYAMKSTDADNSFSSDNLLYIEQFVSDSNGNITFDCATAANVNNSVIFAKAMLDITLDNADIVSSESTDNTITISWDAFPDADKYKVCWAESSSSIMRESDEISETSFTINGLKDSTNYKVYVQSCVSGEWSKYDLNDCIFVQTADKNSFEGWDDEVYIQYVNNILLIDDSDTIALDNNQLKILEHILEMDNAA